MPALYYSGRNNPPHPEVWVNYFLRMVLLYSNKICELSESSSADEISGSLSYLKGKEVHYNESLRHSEDGLLEKKFTGTSGYVPCNKAA